MRKILIRTFVSVVVASAMLMTVLLPVNGGLAILFPLLLLFCAPFPTYVAVIIYDAATKKVFPENKVYAALSGVLFLLFIYHLGLLVGITIVFDKPWHYFIHEYAGEFATTNFPAIALAVSIPLADILIRKIELDLKVYKKKIPE